MRFQGVVWPVSTPRITMPFRAHETRWYSRERPHRGLDTAPFPGSLGEPVLAPVAGRVALVQFHQAAGWDVVIRAALPYPVGTTDLRGAFVELGAFEPFHIRLTHHSQVLVKEGAVVNAGERIARIGSTGTASTGPHVHMEVRKGAYDDGWVLDPWDVFVACIPGLSSIAIRL